MRCHSRLCCLWHITLSDPWINPGKKTHLMMMSSVENPGKKHLTFSVEIPRKKHLTFSVENPGKKPSHILGGKS